MSTGRRQRGSEGADGFPKHDTDKDTITEQYIFKIMEELTTILKQQIIDALNLEDMTPADIDNDAPLFGNEGLGLDSIDALELIVLLEKEYGIKLENPSKGKEVFRSVDVMAKFVSEKRNK